MLLSSFSRPSIFKNSSRSITSFIYSRKPTNGIASPLPSAFLTSLANLNLDTSTNPYTLTRHSHGEDYHLNSLPHIVISPRTVTEIQSLLHLCTIHSIPIIPYGAGTSLEGHVTCPHGGISLSLTPHFNAIIATNPFSLTATVQSGVTRQQLNSHLRDTGLEFTVDPGADASVGGMVATGASGTSAVKYGTMRTNTAGLVVVTPGGDLVTTGTAAVKSSAGYDLTQIYVGSEGTLGVVVEVTVRLKPIPETVVAVVWEFESVGQACEVVLELVMRNVGMAKCEILDRNAIEAFNRFAGDVDDLKVCPTLFLEFHDNEVGVDVVREMGGTGVRVAEGGEERKKLWAARHSLYYASLQMREDAKGVVTDACVPLDKFGKVFGETSEDMERVGIVGTTFGHAGDGNFHCILPVREDDGEEYLKKVREFNDRLVERTLKAGGTCSGEHGVGVGKKEYLKQQYDKETIGVMRSIKRALDPMNIMNPGKIFDWEEQEEDREEIETYLHVAPCGDHWIAPGLFAAKHLQPDYVRSFGPLTAKQVCILEECGEGEIYDFVELYDIGSESVTPLPQHDDCPEK